MLKTELIPASDSSSRRLWIMLHGLGDSMEGYRWMPEAMALPWMNFLLVNAPDEYFGGYSWFDFSGDMTPGVLRSRRLLTELIEQQHAAGYTVDRMILGGFSQGCLMALDTGLRLPRPVAGIVGISGWVYEPEQLLKEIPPDGPRRRVLMTHGTVDPMVPFSSVKQQVQLLTKAGLNIEWQEFQKAHTIAGEHELDVIRGFVERCYAAPYAP